MSAANSIPTFQPGDTIEFWNNHATVLAHVIPCDLRGNYLKVRLDNGETRIIQPDETCKLIAKKDCSE